MKQFFELDWQGGSVTPELVRGLLCEYLGKFGGGQGASVSVVEVTVQQAHIEDLKNAIGAFEMAAHEMDDLRTWHWDDDCRRLHLAMCSEPEPPGGTR